jgi:uncharacterized protein (DUF2164 family)
MRAFSSYNSVEIASDGYDKIRARLISNSIPAKEQLMGARRKLFAHQNLVATTCSENNLDIGGLQTRQFYSFLSIFNKHLYARFRSQPELFDLRISFKGIAREKNLTFWNSLDVGTYFYNLDLSSAYWQIAHKLGYISEAMFLKYQEVDCYKQAKRYCISFLARTNKMRYYHSNVEWTVTCDNTAFKQVYDNIRNELYRCIQCSLEEVGQWLEYNIDGISVMAADVDVARLALKRLGLTFKITECRKTSDAEYLYGSKPRKFINTNLKTNQYESENS